MNTIIPEKCILNLPDKEEFVINPIIDYFTILEKVNLKVIYNPFFRKHLVIQEHLGTYPTYLPEIGYLVALEVISRRLDIKFYEETKDFESFYSDEKIIASRIYNYNYNVNRFVSWGNYVARRVPTNYYNLYISNLVNDFLCTPSIVKRCKIVSPNRWFILQSRTYYFLETEINYNIGILYLTRERLKNMRRLVLWMNFPMEVWEVEAGFVTFTKEGKVLYHDRIPVHFTKEPSKEGVMPSGKGDYFICFMISLNNYISNYPSFTRYKNRITNINLIENLVELVYSPYEIIPFLIPNLMVTSNLESKLIYEFVIKKHIFNNIVRRLEKFSSQQSMEWIKAYEEIYKEQNKLFYIEEEKESYKVSIFNPVIIPFLIKEYILRRDYLKKRLIEEIINDPVAAREKLKSIQNEPANNFQWIQLSGIGPVLKLREDIMRQYLNIWKQNYHVK